MAPRIGIIGHGWQGKTLAQAILDSVTEDKSLQAYKNPEYIKKLEQKVIDQNCEIAILDGNCKQIYSQMMESQREAQEVIGELRTEIAEYQKLCEPEDIFQTIGKIKILESWREETDQLLEQGLLIKLPCKVGDTVYIISEKDVTECILDDALRYRAKYKNLEIVRHMDGFCQCIQTVFLTREEAEQAKGSIPS